VDARPKHAYELHAEHASADVAVDDQEREERGMTTVESEGITEQVREWRTEVVARFASEIGLENVVFEAADPDVFSWYVRNYGIDINLFVDHRVQLECLRAGMWGTHDSWGRMFAYRA
jgi:phosphosulfolactate synthase (CoM biosynthesis protein A)